MLLFRNIIFFRILIVLIVLFNAINLTAQINNIPINEEVTIDKLYAGLLSNTNLLTNTNNLHNASSIQFGARVHLKIISETFQIRAFGVFKKSENNESHFFKSYESIFTPNKNTSIHFGVMATPTTQLRPNPTTWQSQIETNAEKTIIGGRPGIKLNYSITKNFNLSYGIHNHRDNLGHHLKMQYKQLTLSSFIEHQDLFFAAKWKFNQGNVLATRSKGRIAFSSSIPIWSDYKIYTDLEYGTDLQKFTYSEVGLRRIFPECGLIKGFLSISYNIQIKSIEGGLFIHI